jgi:hypothetical protein
MPQGHRLATQASAHLPHVSLTHATWPIRQTTAIKETALTVWSRILPASLSATQATLCLAPVNASLDRARPRYAIQILVISVRRQIMGLRVTAGLRYSLAQVATSSATLATQQVDLPAALLALARQRLAIPTLAIWVRRQITVARATVPLMLLLATRVNPLVTLVTTHLGRLPVSQALVHLRHATKILAT